MVISRSGRRAAVAVAAGGLLGSVVLAIPAQAAGNDTPAELTKAVKLGAILNHLDQFQKFADRDGDNRASGLPDEESGYDESADYVAKKMRNAGYDVTIQEFEFPFFEEFGSTFQQVSPTPTTYVDGEQYDLMDYSGSGDVTALAVPVEVNLTPPRASTSGCEPEDFIIGGVNIVVGKIALLQRGTCPFGTKVANAEAAGAVGAVVFNQGNGDPVVNVDRYELLLGTLGGPVGIPAVGVSYFLGEELVNTANSATGLTLRIQAETTSEIRTTVNVLAQTPTGDTSNVVMAGAHLDSEPDTAGINDNGSGSAALLEVALQMRKVNPTNAVRFAWWGAEEAGLQGSNYYVGNLTDEEAADITLYLNFDMVGSPNYTFGVYDGDDSAAEGSGPGPAGSAQIEDVFEAYFASIGEPTDAADFSGRSDYGPFIAIGIPAGGLFTGAEDQKTEADVALWGGIAGEQKDPCYHDPCDSLTPEQDGAPAGVYEALKASGYRLYGNVNRYALDVNSDAMATAIITFAFDTSMIPGAASIAGLRTADAAVDARGHAAA